MNLAISGSLYSDSACFVGWEGLGGSEELEFESGPLERGCDDDHIQPMLLVWYVYRNGCLCIESDRSVRPEYSRIWIFALERLN